MFTREDRISLVNALEAKSPNLWQPLILVLNFQIENQHPDIDTMKDLRGFTHSFSEKDMTPLVEYYLQKKTICDQFSSIDAFLTFLTPSNPSLSKINLLFLKTLLIPKTSQIIQEKKDVLAYVRLLCSTLNLEEISLFFDELNDDHFRGLFKPFQLPYTHVLMQSEEEGILRGYDLVREKIPSTYEHDCDPVKELIAELFYHWVQQGYSETNNRDMQEYLRYIARYQRAQEQHTQRYNTYTPYSYPLFKRDHALLVDIDLTLIKRLDNDSTNYYQKPLIFNLPLIDKLKKMAIPVFLFTDVACHFRCVWERLKIKQFLEEQGIPVIRILTPGDLIADLSDESLEHLQQLHEQSDDQAFVADFLVQAIFVRLTQHQFPPTLGKAFDDATCFFNDQIKRWHQTPRPDNEQEEWRQIDEIARDKLVIRHDERRQKVCEAMRRIVQLESKHTNRVTHIKWQMLKQFILYQNCVHHINLYDDQERIVSCIQELTPSTIHPDRCIVEAHLVVFPPPPYKPSSYYKPFFRSEQSTATKMTSLADNKRPKEAYTLPTIAQAQKKASSSTIADEAKLPAISGLTLR